MMEELIAAMEIQMNLHRVVLEFMAYDPDPAPGSAAYNALCRARRSLTNNEVVIEHLIRISTAVVQ